MSLTVTPQVSKTIESQDLPKLLTTFIGKSFVVAGLDPSDGGGLTLNIASGSAVINGYLAEDSAGASLSLTDNATNHVFLKLTRNAQGKVNGAAYEVNTTGTQPSDSIKIATVVTSNGAITNITDERYLYFPVGKTLAVDQLDDVSGAGITLGCSIDLGANKIGFSTGDVTLKIVNTGSLRLVRYANESIHAGLQVGSTIITGSLKLDLSTGEAKFGADSATAYVDITTHDGTARRKTLRFIGGQVEWYSWDGSVEQLVAKGNSGYLDIARGRLTGMLDCGGQNLNRVNAILAQSGAYDLYIQTRGDTDVGQRVVIATWDAARTTRLDRLSINHGADTADISTFDSVLKFFVSSGDTYPAIQITPSAAKIELGVGGTSAPDVVLYRGASNILQTDDELRALKVVSNLGTRPYGVINDVGDLKLVSVKADSTNTLVDSPAVRLWGSYWDSTNSVDVDISGSIYLDVTGEGTAEFVVDRDWNIGANKLKTTNLSLYEVDANTLTLDDADATTRRNLRLANLVVVNEIVPSGTYFGLRTTADVSSYIYFQSYNGAFVTNLKLINGTVEIYGGKLTGVFDANGYQISNLSRLHGVVGNADMIIRAGRTAAYAGDAFFIKTYDSLNAETDRLVVTGGVDKADIKIVNAELDLQNNRIKNVGSLDGEVKRQIFTQSLVMGN